MLCVLILYVRGGTYSLTSTPNDRFLRNFFMAGLFIFRDFARNLLRVSFRRNIFSYFILDGWPGIRTHVFGSNKPTPYILDHDLQFKVDSEWQIFWGSFHGNLFTLKVFARNLLRGRCRRNIFSYFNLTWGLSSGYADFR